MEVTNDDNEKVKVSQTGLTVDGKVQAMDERWRDGVNIFQPIILGEDPHLEGKAVSMLSVRRVKGVVTYTQICRCVWKFQPALGHLHVEIFFLNWTRFQYQLQNTSINELSQIRNPMKDGWMIFNFMSF